MALDEDSPLYRRDVERVDRQMDNAAARLFSAETLAHLLKHHPDALGEAIILYLVGEVGDAYQNRHIMHSVRLRGVLGKYYFMRMWLAYLKKVGLPQSRYCLSPDAVKIIDILVEGLFALIVVYRDHYAASSPFPLLPWLHSTEPVEHTFGCARQQRSDFTLMEFYDMARKIRIRMEERVALGKIDDPKATDTAYNHTYFDVRDLNLWALSTYPSDAEIAQIAVEALEDAEALVTVLGVVPEQLYSQSSLLTGSIDLNHRGAASLILSDLDSTDDELDALSDCDEGSDSGTDLSDVDVIIEARRLLSEEEFQLDNKPRSIKEDDEVLSLSMAAAALSLDGILDAKVDDIDTTTEAAIHQAEQDAIHHVLKRAATPAFTECPTSIEQPFSNASSDVLDLSYLVERRQSHQTRRTAESIRLGPRASHASDHHLTKTPAPSAQVQLAREIYATLRRIQGPSGSAGRLRLARWCESNSGGQKSSGNAANAAAVANTTANAIVKKRKSVYMNAGVPKDLVALLSSGRVSTLRSLKVDDFAFVFGDFGLALGKVHALYSKGGGKSGHHGSIEDTVTIGALSLIAVQVFEFSYLHQFRVVTQATSQMQTKHWSHIKPYNFLALLSTAPVENSTHVTVGQADMELFKKLRNEYSRLAAANKMFRSRKKQGVVEDPVEDAEDGEGDA
ncbi:hypothetical protein NM688_g9370 [Phlebia brevispora]|uniref:Uncharacterized protein n=1 Tax=Phlebia brevispora TaxID=194682 RepID=A0ACC1RJY1_9APHY|nr:hypothetical protein NM688_g9370 [Phlebia brevispora]